ncbi:ABC transporter substrate-binding protein [Kitasatospora kifunensis]|uniref:Peptide/nickel transport system substrate-binding protein n=1 Tax=Kitasatospora kifunensis TaxID=58351 RepID=A0A7W7VYZ1_KITKI|nr:ABC transporter substrate-binding protein [Kitasatospora kifunensis]MBB4927209.1 peptide/nickel transport system substrate-binding protein [Kitasatospora kifunensis]
MTKPVGPRRLSKAAVLLAALATTAACGGSGGGGSNGADGPTGSPVHGGVVRVAEAPSTFPNAIWPFDTASQESTVNTTQFQQLLYRPLYYWGLNDKVSLDPDVSIGQTPTWSADGNTVTIQLKPWKWSNGETVTAQDALFWINMSAAETTTGGNYTPPNTAIGAKYFPDNIASATASGQTLTLTLNTQVNQTWFLDNELSQIVPMPLAWDVTGAGQQGKCATDAFGSDAMKSDCAADYNYLSAASTKGSEYLSNPLWSVVNGPWKLKSYDGTSGAYGMVPNPSYSGPQKPYLDEVDFVPYTSATKEYADLQAGSSGANAIDFGYLPAENAATFNAKNPDTGNPLSGQGYYTNAPTYLDSIEYYQINFANPTVGPLFKQPYFTKALQETVDQQGMIDGIYKGWAYPTTGAVPAEPAGNPLSPKSAAEKATYDPAAAKQLLSSHGWDTNQTPAVCTSPGTGANQCGDGIAAGTKAAYTLEYPSGSTANDTMAADMRSDAAKAGISINTVSKAQNTIGTEGVACSPSQPAGCQWQALLYGGWVFNPDYYPTGDALFATGAGPNIWGFSDPKLDQLAAKVTKSNDVNDMYAYEDYIANDQPVIYIPNTLQTNEVTKKLHIDAGDPFQGFEPEYWYYTK